MKTLLDELNTLLANSELNLPSFRCNVSRSGQNKQWLEKNLKRHPSCPDRIKQLVAMPMAALISSPSEAS
ncbi:hypothetical protein JA33_150 [Dickeya phage vB_DsoM_JA33]|uniref:Uncharacterized protein n=4 Tax=Salmondvirus TaxID=2733130 RepID=A0A384ZWE6_9CAUD|nr:hypothetical protein HOU08_gp153 [Dickeya phage vB_DsoM_JA29]YP_009813595.1 hypothetical protein HOU32_gp150 [Dickeya phage vB_DsoM_JA11]AXG66554.1 hypothetical protein JA13_151 [Dickeya phage vB_DsoM_JA13]AXG67524.1 hypothetical protein JA33_150 [Dickeya phage vB_DsoM_JA33]AXG66879.1 hypothetical protein JA29_153 [Dickeya phage vB_DsoM_JA29]AYD79955.1 hypothetical protein JA11_150 [Dickeya phage vB_DsoM_JA11]